MSDNLEQQQIKTQRKIREVFSALNDKIGNVKLNEISPGLGDRVIRLLDIVVPLTSDISVTANVDGNGALSEIQIHRVNAVNRTLACIKNGILIGENCKSKGWKTKHNKINYDFVNTLYSEAQKVLIGSPGKGINLRKRELIKSPLWAKGRKIEFADIDVLSASNMYQYTIILGAPGSGKTTTAKAIATAHFKQDIGEQGQLGSLGLWDDPDNLPIFIDLKSMVSDKNFPDLKENNRQPNVDFFKDYIKRTLFSNDDSVMTYVIEKLQLGQVVLVLDGLDEVPIPNNIDTALEYRREQLQSLIRSIRTVFGNIKIIVTSRPAGYSGWTLEGFNVIHIRPLSSKEAADLARSYYLAAGEDEEESEELSKNLLAELPRLPKKIREYPLFICLLASLYRDKKESFPSKRGGLLQVSLDTLLGPWTMKRHGGKNLQEILNCTPDEIVKCLADISFRVLSGKGEQISSDTPDVPLGVALECFYLLGTNINPREAVDYITNQAGIWTSPATGQLRFVHRLFQEYLAALAVVQKSNSVMEMTELVIKKPQLWHEVALLFADILSNRKEYFALMMYVEQLLRKTESSSDPAMIVGLVSNIIVDEEFSVVRKTVGETASIAFCINELLKYLENGNDDLNGQQRALIGFALNELGDPRKGLSVDQNGIPVFDWMKIPKSKFLMGTDEDEQKTINSCIPNADQWDISREYPRHEVSLAPFEISVFPVTRAQFNAFVLAEDGYSDERWWTTAGWQWRCDEKNNPPATLETLSDNSPQNCVTWYEAIAFCKWVSFKTNMSIRLPSEAEWEYVARGGDNQTQFVWGNNPIEKCANVKETSINRVSPVGCFPIHYRSIPGISMADLNGNIWEWCSTIVESDSGIKYSYPYRADDGREDLEKDDHYFRATRGGYYDGEWMYARSCYRGRDIPSLRAERQGFRVVKDVE